MREIAFLALLVGAISGCDSGTSSACDPILGAESAFPIGEGATWTFSEVDNVVGNAVDTRFREGEAEWTFGQLTCDATGFQRADIQEFLSGIESGVTTGGNPFERPYFESNVLSVGVREVPARPGMVRLELEGRLEAPLVFRISADRVLADTTSASGQRERTWLSAGLGVDSLETRTRPGALGSTFQIRKLVRVE